MVMPTYQRLPFDAPWRVQPPDFSRLHSFQGRLRLITIRESHNPLIMVRGYRQR